jgi:hypothetical protein
MFTDSAVAYIPTALGLGLSLQTHQPSLWAVGKEDSPVFTTVILKYKSLLKFLGR